MSEQKEKTVLDEATITDRCEKVLAGETIWDRLRKAFPFDDVEFINPRKGFNGRHKTANLRLNARALAHRLDAVVGPSGWRMELDYLGDDLIRCRLTICGVVRDGLCRDRDSEPAAHGSFLSAAAHFDIASALQGHVIVHLEIGAEGDIRNLRKIGKALQSRGHVVMKD